MYPEKGDESVTYDELFSGEEHWLGPDADPGWLSPFLVVKDWVEMDPQPSGLRAIDPLETPEMNMVVDVDPEAEQAFDWHDGWPAFAIGIKYIGELLSSTLR